MIEGVVYGMFFALLMANEWSRRHLRWIAAVGALLPGLFIAEWAAHQMLPSELPPTALNWQLHLRMHREAIQQTYRVYFAWNAMAALIVIAAGYTLQRYRHKTASRRQQIAFQRISDDLGA